MDKNKIKNDLVNIFKSALDRVDPYKMITDHIHIVDEILEISFDGNSEKFDLSVYDSIYVFGAGKATAKMALAVEKIFKDRIKDGVIALKKGFEERFETIRTVIAGHPVPDEGSINAVKDILSVTENFDERTLVINLVSGGGSALLEYPLISLDELQVVTKLLLECGANINEINTIRKHLSKIKGGKFLEYLYPATSITLILSDVVGDDLDTIASGLTVQDNTTCKDAFDILYKYGLETLIPDQVLKVLRDGMGESNQNKKTSKSHNYLIGTNLSSLLEARKTAEDCGYNTVIVTSRITGEAKEAAKFLSGIAMNVAANGIPLKTPACIITGGETTVTVRGSGNGGRNQEIALSYLQEIEKYPSFEGKIFFLSASTDGNDGPTDAAGAFADYDLLKLARKKGVDIQEHLHNNDSYAFFKTTDGLLKTGPTNTNVCDIQIQIIV